VLLKGLRILDLADESGAFCAKLLADLGADVVKIERPDGNTARRTGPFGAETPDREETFRFAYQNTNKLAVTLDLGMKADRDVFCRLVETADGLVETFRPGFLEEVGLGYDFLCRVNSKLVHVSITGFGQTGPKRNWLSCGLVAEASGGQMHVSGPPGEAPVPLYGDQAFYAASLFGAVGMLLGFKKREITGRGEYLDLSLQEAVAGTLENCMVRYFDRKESTRRQGNLYPNGFFCILPSEDGFIEMTVPEHWETLIEVMAAEGRAEDLADKKWQDRKYRLEHFDHVLAVVARWTGIHTGQHLFELGQSMAFPWAPLCSPAQVLRNEHLEQRRFFVHVPSLRTGKTAPWPTRPYRLSPGPAPEWRRPPLPGEHDVQIRAELASMDQKDRRRALAARIAWDGSSPRPILQGVRVLDFTWMLAGPYATRILADFGAEVIKVQSRKTAMGAEENGTPFFNAWNRNKRSIAIDMSRAGARDVVLRLAALSDVVVESFSPRVMANWGLAYETFREAREDLIMASVSAMGQAGPWRDFVGLAPTFHALSGLTFMTSWGRDQPVEVGHAYGDVIVGLYAALAILAAMRRRDKTHQGQYIDLSCCAAVCTLLGEALLRAASDALGESEGSDRCMPAESPYGCYRCAGVDRWCVIAVSTDEQWQAFCRVLETPSWKETFSTAAERRKRRRDLDRLVTEQLARQPAEAIVSKLQAAGVPAAVVADAEDLARDEHLAARGFFRDLEHPLLGEMISDGFPLRSLYEPRTGWKRAPLLGEDNHYVFVGLLGLSEQEFARLVRDGVIG
jgi:crotonobetainyl-CoA:carnitine CoA-transferase CaiB-like acyl-CoA transferase